MLIPVAVPRPTCSPPHATTHSPTHSPPQFFCRYEDPSYLKRMKIDILIAIADATNAYEIAEEMSQYVKDTDPGLARAAIRAVGQIALKVCVVCVCGVLGGGGAGCWGF